MSFELRYIECHTKWREVEPKKGRSSSPGQWDGFQFSHQLGGNQQIVSSLDKYIFQFGQIHHQISGGEGIHFRQIHQREGFQFFTCCEGITSLFCLSEKIHTIMLN